MNEVLDDIDRRIVVATQGGLPVVAEPYRAVAESLGLAPGVVMARLQALLDRGAIRRIGVVPNHYAIGYVANGMSVWDVEDDRADEIGAWLGTREAVTHCYRRPRHRPMWNFNLFAMVHGRSRAEVADLVATLHEGMEACFPGACRTLAILYSNRIYKKTGLRIAA
ncbi:MAG: Lrp/AsnC family transcriptional regulator [Proteobacteria bacterium]|nr:Lrp/AsnC family transcriptional regulator [Pseudomonadota bacterium]HQR03498.1 AsnC family transcriptional regulator [Rhodocyclaceae bacterium]